MRVPVLRKLVTVLLDFAHKQELKHPDMFGIYSIEFVVPFKSSKQTLPQVHKVTAYAVRSGQKMIIATVAHFMPIFCKFFDDSRQ